MKNFHLFVLAIIILFSSKNLQAQFSDNSHSDLPTSIAIQPGSYNVSPPGVLSTPVTVSGYDNFYLGTDFGEPYIATNPKDQFNSICAYNTNNYYYTLNGFDWTKINVAFQGFSVIGDPVVAFDSLGNAYYTQLYQNGSTYGICIAKSTNKGVSWTSSYNVASTTVGLSDKEWLTADQTAGPYSNNLYVAWRQFGASNMRAVRSTNGGANWSSPQTYTGGQGAYVAVGANGSIQGGSVYFASSSGNSILVYRSTDGGVTLATPTVPATFLTGGIICAGRNTVKNCIRMDGFPRMAADNSYTSSRGNVYVVYCRNPGTADIADINFVRSTDYGATWSTPVKVNDDTTTTDQWMPTISVDNKTGKVFIAWYDSRVDPVNNIQTKIYATVSTDGGQTFTANAPVSNAQFNPNNMAVGQPGGENYIGDYFGVSAIGNTSYVSWMDSRNGGLGSYTGYYPDFAMSVNNSVYTVNSNDSVKIVVKIPSVNGPFTQRVKFSATLDTLPTSGNISFSFQNGKDSISNFPDSVTLVVKVDASVPTRGYKLNIIGKGTTGPPIHIRRADLLVNSSLVTVGTNRPGIAEFKINGVSYTTQQQLIFPNGTNITVQAVSPRVAGLTQYVFVNWSNGGDTTQTVTVNSNLNLFATYKAQYKLVLTSSVGNSFGGNTFNDSGSVVNFGVLSRVYVSGGTTYYFRGWTGGGNGSYTSSDSTGLDSSVNLTMQNAITETARWTTTVGINQVGNIVPDKYNLYQNYPNPFNPVTNIKFDLIKTGNVKIVVYDLLGKEVAVLLNDVLQPGSYKADFDGESFSSGIYYYKIVTDDFTDVKKMLLIK